MSGEALVGGGLIVYILIAIILGIFLWMVPWIVARKRQMVHTTLLFWVNLLMGWTLIVWVGCLLWAALGERRESIRIVDYAPPSKAPHRQAEDLAAYAERNAVREGPQRGRIEPRLSRPRDKL